MKLVVVSAGLSTPSSTRLLADRLTEAVRARLAGGGAGNPDAVHPDVVQPDVVHIDLRDLAVPIAHHLVTGFPNEELRTALAEVENADGLIAVTPIFTASYSGLFKSFFDLIDVDRALTAKPTLIAATGGTARHSLALEHAVRPLFAYLRAQVVPTAVFAASEDWGSDGDDYTELLPRRIERAAGELADLMAGRAGGAARNRTEEAVVPFAEQLAALRVK
ncbi:FMN reductase [Streptomyces sp. NPDC004111]|uniref:FMN reductase n=1 Tax=Streptomyces sp. NPDC004111 TaxID=3364690 RepID=UPI00368B0C2F